MLSPHTNHSRAINILPCLPTHTASVLIYHQTTSLTRLHCTKSLPNQTPCHMYCSTLTNTQIDPLPLLHRSTHNRPTTIYLLTACPNAHRPVNIFARRHTCPSLIIVSSSSTASLLHLHLISRYRDHGDSVDATARPTESRRISLDATCMPSWTDSGQAAAGAIDT